MLEIILFSISVVFLLIIIFNVSINSAFGPLLRRVKPDENIKPFVSVLVPARNEENNIENCVRSIMMQDYSDFELIVLNDNSTDNTAKVLNELQQEFDFRVINGKKLPAGWLGKNYACSQLSSKAKGEILIFTDADNWHSKDAISRTVSAMSKFKLSFLSAFPQQITKSFSEKLIIPVIDLILYSLLVLWMNYFSKNPAFAAANGQWIAVRKEEYESIGGHSSVKDKVVEDVSLCRVFKRKGKRVMTMAGTGIVYGRMYNDFSGIWEGLSKNIFGLSDFKLIPFVFILGLLLFVSFVPFVFVFFNIYFFLILIFMLMLWRLLLSINFRHNVIISVFLHSVSILMLVAIGINSVIKYYKGGIKWKEREINLK
jgi:chlorobactene glucosyltransferase